MRIFGIMFSLYRLLGIFLLQHGEIITVGLRVCLFCNLRRMISQVRVCKIQYTITPASHFNTLFYSSPFLRIGNSGLTEGVLIIPVLPVKNHHTANREILCKRDNLALLERDNRQTFQSPVNNYQSLTPANRWDILADSTTAFHPIPGVWGLFSCQCCL
jgi:hypothetical protein